MSPLHRQHLRDMRQHQVLILDLDQGLDLDLGQELDLRLNLDLYRSTHGPLPTFDT